MTQEYKKALRATLRAHLAALSAEERAAKSAAAVARFVASAEFERAQALLLYDSMGTEVSTQELMALCLARGKTLCLPRTDSATRAMTARAVSDLAADLEPTRWGFREPLAERPEIVPSQIELVLTPGLGFDSHGNRLGRGAGYYDRFLCRPDLRAVLCVLAFECQIVSEIPHEPHDRSVQVIFTEDRTIRP